MLFGLLMLVIGFLLASNTAAGAYAAAVCTTATATPTITPTLANPLPTASADQGTQDNPIPLNTIGTYTKSTSGGDEVFTLSLSKIALGADAAKLANGLYNSTPTPDQQFMVAYVTGVYVSGPKTKAGTVTSADFLSLSDSTLSKFSLASAPKPELNFTGFPGGKFKGWIILYTAADDPNPLISFDTNPFDGSGGIYFATH
jgi:hypothetical protein